MNNIPQNQPPQGQPQQPYPQQGQPAQPYPQQMPPQGQYPGGPQQYGQQPYYGPPKKSSNALVIILVCVVGFMVVGCLGLAAIPLIVENSGAKDARRAEAEAVAGTTKTGLRAMYARTGAAPESSDSQVRDILNRATGEHISSVSYKSLSGGGAYSSSRNAEGEITVHMKSPSDGTLIYTFNFTNGIGQFRWQP